MEQEICKECGQLAVLNKHVRKHNLTSEEYYRKWLMKPGEGFCKTCGKPTRFCGLTDKCFQPYCSNKCHNTDSEFLFKRSLARKNKTPEEKAEIRAKQIAAWQKSMGDDWAHRMAQHGFETYKERTGYNTPWENPEVRQKCEIAWGGKAPAVNADVKAVLSEKAKTQMAEVHAACIQRDFEIAHNKCKDIISYDGHFWTYKCPECEQETLFGYRKLATAERINDYTHLCCHCHSTVGHSFKEHALYELVKTLYDGTIIKSDRIELNGKELDVWLPEIRVGFEFDGVFWHADRRFFAPDDVIISNVSAQMIWEKDAKKDALCKEKGITLFHVLETDWDKDYINTKEKISEVIKHAKCKIK